MGIGLFVLVIGILTACGLSDAILRSTWQRFYYTRGFTFFTKDYDFPYVFNIKRLDILMKRENADKKYKSDIVFNIFAKNAIAFYDKPSRAGFGVKKRSYFSVLHGIMVYKDGKLTVAGVFDYLALLFIPVMMIAITAYSVRTFKEGYWINAVILAALLVIFIIGFIYTLRTQKKRFIEIGNIMVQIGQKEKDKDLKDLE